MGVDERQLRWRSRYNTQKQVGKNSVPVLGHSHGKKVENGLMGQGADQKGWSHEQGSVIGCLIPPEFKKPACILG